MKRFKWLFAYFFILTALFLIFSVVNVPDYFKRAKLSLTSFLETPFSLSRGVSLRIRYFFKLPDIITENRRLKLANEKLRMALLEAEESEQENKRLKKLLDYKEIKGCKSVVARVIGMSGFDFIDGIVIDKGSKDGIKKGAAVMAQGALIGKVEEVSASSAKVLLIQNPNLKISAIIQSTRDLALIQSGDRQGCILNYIPKDSEVSEGDKVLTSGLSQIYPKGLLIGHIKVIKDSQGEMFKYAVVEIAADLNSLEEVICLVDNEN